MGQNLAAFVAKLGTALSYLNLDTNGNLKTIGGTTGPAGAAGTQHTDAQGNLLTAQNQPANYAAAYAGVVGFAANQAGATTSIGLATTYTGLCLSNPAASGKNLAIMRVAGTFNVAPAALTSIGLIVGFAVGGITAHTTPLTPTNGLIGTLVANPLVGLADAACTLVGASANAPSWARWIAVTPAATSVLSFNDDVAGALIIPPGGYCAIGTSIASPAAGLLASMTWEERPL